MSVELAAGVAVFLRDARVARLATLGPYGPHVVPVCPVFDGDRILIATDPTMKTEHVRADPRVGLAVDDYEEDWSRLRGVSVTGRATLHEAGVVCNGDARSCTRSTPSTSRRRRSRSGRR